MFVLGVAWAALVSGALLAPHLVPDDDPADVVTRQTARVAVLFWGVAVGSLLLDQRGWGRAAWTYGCAAFLVHVATAFERVHGWSHAAAVAHVEAVSGFGSGLFVSYAFAFFWLADTCWWWIDRRGYDARPVWIDRALHGFMAFVVFNGTVVYETGFVRRAGAVLFAVLLLFVARRLVGR